MRRTLFAVTLATTLALPALAGPPPAPTAPPAPAAPFAGKREEMRAKVQQKIQTYLTVELSSRLGLDEKKSLKLSDAIKAHMERKHGREKKLHEEMQKLQSLVDSKAPDAQVKAQLDVVTGAAGRDDDMQAFIVDTQKFLTVQEQAKLALAMPDILKEVHKMVRQAHREMKGGGGGFGGKPGADDEE